MNPVNLTKPPRLSNRAARKLFLDRHGLGRPPEGEDLARLIERLGFVQIDSIATVERIVRFCGCDGPVFENGWIRESRE